MYSCAGRQNKTGGLLFEEDLLFGEVRILTDDEKHIFVKSHQTPQSNTQFTRTDRNKSVISLERHRTVAIYHHSQWDGNMAYLSALHGSSSQLSLLSCSEPVPECAGSKKISQFSTCTSIFALPISRGFCDLMLDDPVSFVNDEWLERHMNLV